MRCRRSKQFEEMRGLAFFGSYGHTEEIEQVTNELLNTHSIYEENVVLETSNSYVEAPARLVYDAQQTWFNIITLTFPSGIMPIVMYVIYEDGTYSSAVVITQATISSTHGAFRIMFKTAPSVSPAYAQSVERCYNETRITYRRVKHLAIKTEDGETFAKEQEGVACSLTQRLSLIKGELWYQINTGLPLFDKQATSTSFDSWIIQTIMQHPDVVSIKTFNSSVEKHKYHCVVIVITRWGEVEITI